MIFGLSRISDGLKSEAQSRGESHRAPLGIVGSGGHLFFVKEVVHVQRQIETRAVLPFLEGVTNHRAPMMSVATRVPEVLSVAMKPSSVEVLTRNSVNTWTYSEAGFGAVWASATMAGRRAASMRTFRAGISAFIGMWV